mgnify:CR=1 FL=1
MSLGNAGVTHTPASFFTPLVALAQGLLDDHGKIALLGLAAGLIEVHEHRHKGRLPLVVMRVTT